MDVTHSIPAPWLAEPPHILVAGDGPFAAALALILKSGRIELESLRSDPPPLPGGAYPLALDELQRVFLVGDAHHGPADLLTAHAGVWRWVERLSEEREQHPLAVIFVLPPETGDGLIASLALALGLDEIDPASTGHSVVRMGDPLEELLATASRTVRRDAVVLRNRIETNQRHRSLRGLLEAARSGHGNDEALKIAATGVLGQFAGREYDLDMFCRSPHHSNGNVLRGAIRRIVTGAVTPESREEILLTLAPLR